MKKLSVLFLAVILAFSLFGCNEKSDEKTDISLKYYADASEMIPALKQGVIKFGLLPEPALTKAMSMIENSEKLFDLQQLYGETSYPQAVLVAKSSLIEEYPELITSFISEMENNEEYLLKNTEKSVNALNSVLEEGAVASLSAANINQTVIENCNIRTEYAIDIKTKINNYLSGIKNISDNSALILNDTDFADVKALKGLTNTKAEKTEINFFAPDGAPALAVAKLVAENYQFGETVNYNIVSPKNLGVKVVQKTADIAILPVNLASKLINANGYKLLTVNTHGNLYIIGTENIDSLKDLEGK